MSDAPPDSVDTPPPDSPAPSGASTPPTPPTPPELTDDAALPLRLPTWAPWVPWVTLWLLELPSYHWLWGFRLSKVSLLGEFLPLLVYLGLGTFFALLGWILEPVATLIAPKRNTPTLHGGWQFAWNSMWAFGLFAIATPLHLYLSPNSHPGGSAAWIASLLGCLLGLGIGQGLLMGLHQSLKSNPRAVEDPQKPGRSMLLGLMAMSGMLAMGAVWSQITPGRPGDPPPPNVLLVTLDTVNITRLSTYGYDKETTPNLTRLAEEGAKFTQAYAHVPLTQPSHATIFTGLQPQAIGVYENARPTPFRLVTLAELFRGQGYFTAGIPATRVMEEKYYIHQGFDRWPERSAENGIKSLQWMRLFPARYARIVWGSSLDLANLVDDAKYSTKRALEAVDYAQHRPWMMWVHYYDPHAPYTLPESERPKYLLEPLQTPGFNPDKLGTITQLLNLSYDGLEPLLGKCFMQQKKMHPLEATALEIGDLQRMYDAQLKYTDDYLGELLDGLKERGQLENTLVVITADHGEALFERGYFGHNHFLHQDEVHVPLIMWWPGKIQPKVIDTPCALSDIYPTILQLMRIEFPNAWQQVEEAQRGHKLAGWLNPDKEPEPYGPVYLQQFTFSRATVTPNGEKLIFQAVKGRTERAVNPFPGPMWLWYDIDADPHELLNRAGAVPEDLPEATYREFVQMQSLLNRQARGIEPGGVEELNYQAYLALAISDAERKVLESLGYISPTGPATMQDESECAEELQYTEARQAELAQQAADPSPEPADETADEEPGA